MFLFYHHPYLISSVWFFGQLILVMALLCSDRSDWFHNDVCCMLYVLPTYFRLSSRFGTVKMMFNFRDTLWLQS